MPGVDVGVAGSDPVDQFQFLGAEGGVAQGTEIFIELGGRGRAEQDRGHPAFAQQPGDGQLGQGLAAGLGNPGQGAGLGQVFLDRKSVV